jgi:hypothetical protein
VANTSPLPCPLFCSGAQNATPYFSKLLNHIKNAVNSTF